MATKTATKPIINKTRTAKAVEQVVPHDEEQSAYERMRATVSAALHEYFIATGAPSWKMQIVGSLVGLVTMGVALYGGLALVDLLMLAALTATASSFVAFMVWFIGGTITLWLSLNVFTLVSDRVSRINVGAIKSRVSGWFKRVEAA